MGKFGNTAGATAAEVWAAATRTLTDISAEEIFDLPLFDSSYPTASVTSGAGANTFGSYAELVADVGEGKRLIFCVVTIRHDQTRPFEVEFAEGADGSEVVIARLSGYNGFVSASGNYVFYLVPLWRSISDDARLSARVRDNSSGALVYQAAVQVA